MGLIVIFEYFVPLVDKSCYVLKNSFAFCLPEYVQSKP